MSKVQDLLKRQLAYLASCGGSLGVREADQRYNDLNREIIEAYRQEHDSAYIGKVNIYDVPKEKILSGEYSVLQEYSGQTVYNFGCSFIVPCKDETLEQLILAWTRNAESGVVEKIMKRIEEIGGQSFVWY